MGEEARVMMPFFLRVFLFIITPFLFAVVGLLLDAAVEGVTRNHPVIDLVWSIMLVGGYIAAVLTLWWYCWFGVLPA